MIGASTAQIGTAVGQQSRAVVSPCNALQITAPEAYIRVRTEFFPEDGEVADKSTRDFIKLYTAGVPRARCPRPDRLTPCRS
jgi:chromate reductase